MNGSQVTLTFLTSSILFCYDYCLNIVTKLWCVHYRCIPKIWVNNTYVSFTNQVCLTRSGCHHSSRGRCVGRAMQPPPPHQQTTSLPKYTSAVCNVLTTAIRFVSPVKLSGELSCCLGWGSCSDKHKVTVFSHTLLVSSLTSRIVLYKRTRLGFEDHKCHVIK